MSISPGRFLTIAEGISIIMLTGTPISNGAVAPSSDAAMKSVLQTRGVSPPALEFSYTDNGAYYNKTGKPAVNPFATDSKAQSVSHIWTSSWNIAIPVTAGYRITLSNNVRLRINAGVYFSEALAVRHFVNTGNSQNPVYEKRKVSSDFGNDFQIGTVGSFSVETGPHFSYFFRTQYPFLKDRWSTSTVTLALGVGYSF